MQIYLYTDYSGKREFMVGTLARASSVSWNDVSSTPSLMCLSVKT